MKRRKKEEKKQQYGLERYKSLSEYEKTKLVEYRKKYYKMRRCFIIHIKSTYL